jgi:tetratricopeptide (TPR) repeat protein
MRITLCMIVRDEAERLPACLASVAGLVDEIVVVDTGSTDDTPEIAARGGALVLFEPWADDFAAARNVGLAAASKDWILVLDADECLASESAQALRGLCAGPPMIYDLRIRNVTDAPDALEHYTCRLFPNAPHLRFVGAIHETVVSLDPERPAHRLLAPDVVLLHVGYQPEIVQARGKVLRNLKLLRKSLERDPSNPFHHYNLGLTLRWAGQLDEAVDALETCVRLSEGLTPAFLHHAYVSLQSLAIQAEGWDRAQHWTQAGAEACTLSPDYWVNKGVCLVRQGKISEGIEAYTQAYELGQQPLRVSACDRASMTWKPFVAIAQAWQLAGDADRAELFLQSAYEIYPQLANRSSK